MKRLILAACFALIAQGTAANPVVNPVPLPTFEFPEKGVFCGFLTLCEKREAG